MVCFIRHCDRAAVIPSLETTGNAMHRIDRNARHGSSGERRAPELVYTSSESSCVELVVMPPLSDPQRNQLLDALPKAQRERIYPPLLWRHLGEQFGVAAPDLASLRAMYRRAPTLIEHRYGHR
jgi:hypothetical protein